MQMKIKKFISLENFAYLIIFLLPFYLIKVDFFIFPINMLEILILGMFFFWLFKQKKINLKNYYNKYKKYIFSLSFIFLGLSISAFINGSNYVSWGIIKGWFFVPLLFLFLLFEVIEEDKIENIFNVFFFSAFFVAIIALVYLFLGKLTYDGRLQSFFNSPNYLAMYLAPALIIAFLKQKNIDDKILVSLCLIILIPFYFTYSYAAWFSVLIAILIVFFMKNKIYFQKNILQNKKVIILMFIIFLFISFQSKSTKLDDLISFNKRSSLASRNIIWKVSSEIIKDNLVFGIGPGNFQEKYLEYQKFYPPYLEWAVPHPHNIFLTFWLSGGILGLLGFLSLLFFYFKDIFTKIKKENTQVFFLSLGIILVILIHGTFDTTYFKNDLAVIFWFSFLVLKR